MEAQHAWDEVDVWIFRLKPSFSCKRLGLHVLEFTAT